MKDESTGVLTVILDDDAAPIPALSGPLLIVLTLLLGGLGVQAAREYSAYLKLLGMQIARFTTRATT